MWLKSQLDEKSENKFSARLVFKIQLKILKFFGF
jgi:hypothetical protein